MQDMNQGSAWMISYAASLARCLLNLKFNLHASVNGPLPHGIAAHRTPVADDNQSQPRSRPHHIEPPRIVDKPDIGFNVAPDAGEDDHIALPALVRVDCEGVDGGWETMLQCFHLLGIRRKRRDLQRL